jgi:AraC-like DNA-binding protein
MLAALDGTRETVMHSDDMSVVQLYINREVEDYPMHWHTDVEIIMPVENIYTVVVDKKTYVLNVGDIIILPSGEIHELYAPPSGRRLIVLFDNSIFNSIRGIDSISSGFYPCVLIPASDDNPYYKQLSSLLEQIADEYLHRSPLSEALIQALFMHFFVYVGRNCIKGDRSENITKKQKWHLYIDKFLGVRKYINEHCTENLTLDELALYAGFSKYHFSRLFYDFTGATFYDYLMKRRIINAEALLCDPNLSILEIAMQSGFNSLATFNRNFRSIKKCTPSEYRSMYQNQRYREAPLSNIV